MEELFNFEYLRENNYLLYEYVRGSTLYGINREGSDIDKGGIFIEPLPIILKSPLTKAPELVMDAKGDTVWNSLIKFTRLLYNSNPNILEALFVPDDKILYKNPIIEPLLLNRDKFLTKKCFGSFMGYSKTQLSKARSLGKKVVIPENQPEPFVLDSVFTFNKQGSIRIKEWLGSRKLLQKYCGLVCVPNMTGNFGCFYDFNAHLKNELGIKSEDQFLQEWRKGVNNGDVFFVTLNEYYSYKKLSPDKLWKMILSKEPKGYRGIVKDSQEKDSKQLRLSPVRKDEKPICYISFDSSAYTQRCVKYKEWKDWLNIRNEERYQEVVSGKRYDCKNLTHCCRLLNMGIEIASGKGLIIDRTNIDRDFLMQIRTGQIEYDEIIKYLESKDEEMKKVMENSKLPDEVDKDMLNKLICDIYDEFYTISKK